MGTRIFVGVDEEASACDMMISGLNP